MAGSAPATEILVAERDIREILQGVAAKRDRLPARMMVLDSMTVGPSSEPIAEALKATGMGLFVVGLAGDWEGALKSESRPACCGDMHLVDRGDGLA
jgi:hypothetical protein